jgi:hypothetical protein
MSKGFSSRRMGASCRDFYCNERQALVFL